MLDNKTMVILKPLLYHSDTSLYELGLRTKLPKTVIEDYIQDINDILLDYDLPIIVIEGQQLRVPQDLKEQAAYVESLCRYSQVSLSQEERLNMIYLYTFCRQDYVSNNHYQDLLKVSRNTTLTDIKALREHLKRFDLLLDYSRSEGYRLVGSENDKLRLALFAISELLHQTIGDWAIQYIMAEWGTQSRISELEQLASDLAEEQGLSPIQDRLQECLYLFELLMLRLNPKNDVSFDVLELRTLSVVEVLTEPLLTELIRDDDVSERHLPYLTYQITRLLMGCFEGNSKTYDVFFASLTSDIIREMERLSLLTFDDRDGLEESLQKHLVPAYYRLTSQLISVNSYTDSIKNDYGDLFWLVKKALLPLENAVGYPIPDSEVSYFVIHFGGYLRRQEDKEPYKALIVCPNGVSTSLLLKEALQSLFSNIKVVGVAKFDSLDDWSQKGLDMIFSTISIQSSLPHYLVSPMMTQEQRQDLLMMVQGDFPDAVAYVNETSKLIKLIKKYGHITDEYGLKQAITQFLQQMTETRKDVRPLLHELITKETYQHSNETLEWREAIRLGAKPLLEQGKIEASYIDAMIGKVEEFGPFIDLGKGIAIPHARPEDGAKEVGMSMLVLDNPIFLADDPAHEIKLLICISAIDNASHLKALSHLTKLLRKDEYIQALLESKQFEEIKTIIQQEED